MKVRLSALVLCALLLAGCRQVEEVSASLPPEPVPQTAQELLEEAKAGWYREQTRKLALENDGLERMAGQGAAAPAKSAE